MGRETFHSERVIVGQQRQDVATPSVADCVKAESATKDVIHGHDTGCHGAPPAQWQLNPATLPLPSHHVTYQPSHHLGGPSPSLLRRPGDSILVAENRARWSNDRGGRQANCPLTVSQAEAAHGACPMMHQMQFRSFAARWPLCVERRVAARPARQRL